MSTAKNKARKRRAQEQRANMNKQLDIFCQETGTDPRIVQSYAAMLQRVAAYKEALKNAEE